MRPAPPRASSMVRASFATSAAPRSCMRVSPRTLTTSSSGSTDSSPPKPSRALSAPLPRKAVRGRSRARPWAPEAARALKAPYRALRMPLGAADRGRSALALAAPLVGAVAGAVARIGAPTMSGARSDSRSYAFSSRSSMADAVSEPNPASRMDRHIRGKRPHAAGDSPETRPASECSLSEPGGPKMV